MQFSSCRGKDHCTEDGTHCDGCGRGHDEIAKTRQLIGAIANLALEMGYENYAEFTTFVGEKAAKKIGFTKQQQEEAQPPED